MFTFNYWATPAAWWLLLPLFVLGGWYFVRYPSLRIRLPATYSFGGISGVPILTRWLAGLPQTLMLVAMLAGILALARPQRVTTWEDQAQKGSDVFLLIDISRSMQEKKDRLQRLKAGLIQAIDSGPSHRIGIILFGEEAYTYLPLTWDRQAVLTMLARIQWGLVPAEGTSLGNALALALHRLEAAEAQAPQLVVFTDGGSNMGMVAPFTVARLAAQRGIPINSCIYPSSALSAPEDSLVYTQIAALTGGSTLFLRSEEDLSGINQLIGQKMKEGTGTLSYRIAEDLYPWWLILASICCLVGFALKVSPWGNPLEM